MTKTEAPTTLTDELNGLTHERDERYADVQKAKGKRRGWDAETQAMRGELTARRSQLPEEHGDSRSQYAPKPGTESHEFAEKVKARMSEENPHESEVAAAVARYHPAQEALALFRAEHLEELIAEAGPPLDQIHATLREAADLLEMATGLYLTKEDAGRCLVEDQDGIDLSNYGGDPRAVDWNRLAATLREAELTPPGVDRRAREQQALQVSNIERRREEASNARHA